MKNKVLMPASVRIHKCNVRLATVINLGAANLIEGELKLLWEAASEAVSGVDHEEVQRINTVLPQEVFIEPEYIHAYVKLNSALSGLVASIFLNGNTAYFLAVTKHYIERVAKTYQINLELSST